jgi:hypothetical protein
VWDLGNFGDQASVEHAMRKFIASTCLPIERYASVGFGDDPGPNGARKALCPRPDGPRALRVGTLGQLGLQQETFLLDQ